MKLRELACAALLAMTAQAADRDWAAFPAVAETDAKVDVYVVGDVHADYQRLLRVLAAAGVIDRNTRRPAWRAGDSIVVFMGDLIDKGPRALDVLGFVAGLQMAARAAGGQVFSLMGNHEAEFLAEPTLKKSREFREELARHGIGAREVAACRGEVGNFLCEEPFALRIRDWFFSHGGDTHGRTLAALSADLEAGVKRDGFRTRELIGADSILEARLGEKGEGGRPWVEEGPEHDARALLTRYTKALGVKHLVQAHQHAEITFADGLHREKGQMFERDGMLFLVDVGMSQNINDSEGAVMLIKAPPAEEAIAICASGERTKIWDSGMAERAGAAKVCRGK